MIRLTAIIILVCVALGTFLLPVRSPLPVRQQREPKFNHREATLELLHFLSQPVKTKPLQDKVKLKQAIDYFSDYFKGKLTIVVNRESFAAFHDPNAPDNIYDEEIQLPPAPDVMLMSSALKIILEQVAKGEATYVIRQGVIEIVPENRTRAKSLLSQPVLVSFNQQPLDEVLQDLSDFTGLSINLDGRIEGNAKTPITASFRQATLEDALVTVTESADLKFVVLAKSVFVTTPANALALQEEEKKRASLREPIVEKRGGKSDKAN